MRRLRAFFSGAAPAMLIGAFFTLALFRLGEHQGARLGGLVFGALYGLAVLGLIRMVKVAPWGSWISGLVAGAVPVALVVPKSGDVNDRAGVWLLASILGLLIGGIEHARLRRDAD